MKKEYPTIDGFQTVLKILKEMEVEVDYLHQEIIRSELMVYRKKILEETLGIYKDPVPISAVDVVENSAGKGVFIFFLNPLDYVEIIEDDGRPAKKEDLTSLNFISLIGLFVSKENPDKTRLSIAPSEILEQIKKLSEKKFISPQEKITPDNPIMDN